MLTSRGGLSKFDPVSGICKSRIASRETYEGGGCGLTCSHHYHPAEIDETGNGCSHEDLQRRIVLLR